MNKVTKISCCFHCEDRRQGCHSECEKYKEERNAYEQTMAIVHKNRNKEMAYIIYHAKRMEKQNKNRG